MVLTFTGRPDTLVGENLACQAGLSFFSKSEAAQRPASPGPHREAGGYHEDRCAGSGACVSYVSALDVSGSNATDR